MIVICSALFRMISKYEGATRQFQKIPPPLDTPFAKKIVLPGLRPGVSRV